MIWARRFGVRWDANARRRFLRIWLIFPVQGLADLVGHYGLRLLPIDWCSAIGGWLGVLVGRYRFKTWTRRARENYRRIVQHPVSDAELDAAMDRLWNNIGRSIAELSVIDRLWPAGRIAVVGEQHFYDAQARGPVITMPLHLGNWEIVGPATKAYGLDVYAVYEIPNNPVQRRIVERARARYGKRLLSPGADAAHRFHRILMEKDGLIAIWPDAPTSNRIGAPLFGRQPRRRSNLTLIARLAMMTGAMVVPGVVERLGGAHFRLTALPGIQLTGDPGDAAALDRAVHQIDDVITPIIRDHLDQWLLLPGLRLDRP